MRSFVPMLRKSHSAASRSAMRAALGVSIMTPRGTFGSCAMPSRARSAHTSRQSSVAARSSATPEMSGKRICMGPTAAARDAHGRGQLVAAEVERAEGDRAPLHALQRRDSVQVLLVLRRQVGALEVEELGAEEADGARAQIDGDGDLLEHLDVGGEVDVGAVDGDGGRVARRLEVARTLARDV